LAPAPRAAEEPDAAEPAAVTWAAADARSSKEIDRLLAARRPRRYVNVPLAILGY
jgi:hypothetical protein